MKKYIAYIFQTSLILLAIGFSTCNKDDENDNLPLLVETLNITDVSYHSVKVNGEVLQGKAAERGVCWGTSDNPTVSDSKTASGAGTGTFSAEIDGLNEGTVYYFRVYAISGSDVVYGEVKNCRTYEYGSPIVGIVSVKETTMNSFTCEVRVIADGGKTVQKRGICWSKTPQPTSDLATSTSDGSGSGAFTSTAAALEPETSYYVRPYAVYEGGTAYGVEKQIQTGYVVESIRVSSEFSKTETSVAGTFTSVFSPENANPVEQGVVYSLTNQEPTLENATVIKASGLAPGTYSFQITGMTPKLAYYVRAYVKTANYGTRYSSVIQVSTPVSYNFYLGEYTMYYSIDYKDDTPTRSLPVSLVQGSNAYTYYLKGILADESVGNISVTFDSSTGDLTSNAMIICKTPENYDFWWLAAGTNAAGSLYSFYYTYCGLRSSNFASNDGKMSFKMTDYVSYSSSYKIIGFRLRNYEGTTNRGDVNGKDGQPLYYYPEFVKK
ncbi:MAG: hypothetical protein LBR64_09625 [Dysgonamonadaceae bacterium]|jgi:hypothetical protein|nr:hypothetical protein [Dysgonamonadaceae bacterium]